MKISIRFAAPIAVVALLFVHCYPPVSEGDRCNIALSHNECANDPTVQCVVPTNCAVAYCCSPTSTSPNCQACPVDGGAEAGDDGGADAPSDSAGEATTDAAPADAAEGG